MLTVLLIACSRSSSVNLSGGVSTMPDNRSTCNEYKALCTHNIKQTTLQQVGPSTRVATLKEKFSAARVQSVLIAQTVSVCQPETQALTSCSSCAC